MNWDFTLGPIVFVPFIFKEKGENTEGNMGNAKGIVLLAENMFYRQK